MTSAAAIVLFTSASQIPAFASTQTYTVQPGDTMYKISVKEGVTLSALEAANAQVQNFAHIYPGQVLQLPASTGSNSSTAQTAGAVRDYVVQPGDTLYKISVAHKISLSALIAANPQIQNVNDLAVGQVIHLPAASSAGTVNSSSPNSSTQSSSTPASITGSSRAAKAQAILDTAESYLGVPYAWGGSSPSTGFDCSGFVQYVFAKNGIMLPRESHDQAAVGVPVSQSALQPGDLLFFTDTDSYASQYANHVTHVGIYMGNGNMIESSSANNGQGVIIVTNVFGRAYYVSHYYGARDDISPVAP
ncbi:MAG: C40 family peptidase [Alicyclobacillus sp.]|nr:C40 family peptidase [Alicyclobacillus sp.]